VHLSIFISVFNQLDAQNLFHNKFYFVPLHVSNTVVLIIWRSKLDYTASGIITPIGGRLVHETARICCHNTDYIHINGLYRTILVILAKHSTRLPDDGSFVIRNMLEHF